MGFKGTVSVVKKFNRFLAFNSDKNKMYMGVTQKF
jgi:hypothetical protein